MKRTIMLLGALSTTLIFGQSTGISPENKFTITTKSPDASQLSKFVDIPNATSTGTIGVDIPIYTLVVDGYKLPIELKHHASGVKVRELATKVGLGWSLSIGGISLSKQIFGADDRGWIPYINPTSFNPNENENDNGLAAHITGFIATAPETSNRKYDTQPDIYSYSIGKFSGEFYLSSTGQVIQVPYNNTKIILNGVLFEMTDDQGIQYFFSPVNQMRTLGGSIPTDDDYWLSMTDYKIDKIKLPSGKVIKFNYIKTDYYKYISNSTNRYEVFKDCQYSTTNSVYREFLSRTEVFDEQSIQSIEFGNEKVEFTYSNNRQDLMNGLSLDRITVKNGTKEVLAYDLLKDYFTTYEVLAGDPTTAKRLKLKGVVNLNDGSKYKLTYNEEKSLPNRLSNATDHFGFSNGGGSDSGIPFTEYGGKVYGSNIDKEHHLEYAISGSLKRIEYPTGGSMEIEYEGDDYYTTKKKQKIVQMGVTVDSDVTPYHEFSIAGHNIVESGYDKVTFNVHFSSPVNPPNNTFDLPQKSYFEGEIMDENGNILHNIIFTGSLPLTLDRRAAYRLRIQKVNLPGQAPHINLDEHYATLGLSWTERITEEIAGNYKTGGLRVKKIIKRDENNTIAQSVEYNYNDDSGKSTGNYVGDDVNYIYTSPLPMDKSSTICQITMIGNIGSFNASTINGKPIVYDRVQTKFLGSQESYKVVDTYSNRRGQNPIGLNPSLFTYFDGKYNLGQIKKKDYFNSSGALLKSTEFQYENDYYFNKFSKDYNPAEPYLVIKPYSILISGYNLLINIGSPYPAAYRAFYNVERYNISSAWVKQKSILSKTYFNNRQLTELREYFYDPNYKHLSPVKETVTYSDSKISEFSYAFAHEKGNQKLINANMIGIPLETSLIEKLNINDANGKVISKTETKYDNPAHLLPTSVLSYDLKDNTSASTEVTYDQYDSNGNLQQYTSKDKISTVIIWGYNNTQPIAKIENIKLAAIQQSYITAIVNASNTDAAGGRNNDESSLLSAFTAFRGQLPNHQITTYSYDPLIGVRSITPPSGITEKYIYDTANRLQKIVDVNGQVLKEYKYNYKN